jgi:hypothetical protein
MELPEELLWTIMGFMDDRTMCTTRLVCKRFRKISLSHLKALHLDCKTLKQHPTTDFTLCPAVTQCAVSFRSVSYLHLAGHPRVAPIITHIHVKAFQCPEAQIVESLAQLMHLTRLRPLSLPAVERDLCSKLSLPLGLEELKMARPLGVSGSVSRPWGYGMWDAAPLSRYCKLTELKSLMGEGVGLSVGSLASLSSLRSLELWSYGCAKGELSRFTILTSLTWILCAERNEWNIFCQGLARLTRLSQLSVRRVGGVVSIEDLACVSHLTGLTRLDIRGWNLPNMGAESTVLLPLTRLVSLEIQGGRRAMAVLSTLNIEVFESLAVIGMEREDVSVLQRATTLTHLEFTSNFGIKNGDVFGHMLATLTGLRSLSVTFFTHPRHVPDGFPLAPVLQALRGLTKLVYRGNFMTQDGWMACASLPCLQSMEVDSAHKLTSASLAVLQAMSGLTELRLSVLWDHRLREVRAGFDEERLRRGWPRLKLDIL